MPPSVCPRRAVPSKIMCTVQWASNLHLLPQFTFLSTFFFFFQTPVFAQSCQALAEGKAWESRLYILNLTPFFASRPKTDKHFLQPPDWGCGVLTQKGVGLCGCVSLQLPGCPRPDEERKGIVGTRGRHKKLRSRAFPHISSGARDVQSGRLQFQGKRNGPSQTLRSGPRRPGRICLFFSPQGGFPPLQQLRKKARGIVNSNFAG